MANIEKFPLEARGETVSREALVQAALHEITQNYREASLSNVARNFQILRHRDLSAQKKMHCTKRQYIFQEEPGVFMRWPGRAGCGCGGTPGG